MIYFRSPQGAKPLGRLLTTHLWLKRQAQRRLHLHGDGNGDAGRWGRRLAAERNFPFQLYNGTTGATYPVNAYIPNSNGDELSEGSSMCILQTQKNALGN